VKGDKYKKLGMHDTDTASGKGNMGYEAARQEHQRLDSLMVKLKAAVENNLALEPFRDQLLIDITPEGLRIQIIDKEGRPMFDSGSAILKYYTVELLNEISGVIQDAPNKISITGHTDATPFTRRKDYSNWELSADRANAARRTLLAGGIETDKIGRVVGLSSTALFDQKNPTSPVNRRISIVVMNKQTEMAMMMGDSQEYMGEQPRSTEFINRPILPERQDSSFIEQATPPPAPDESGATGLQRDTTGLQEDTATGTTELSPTTDKNRPQAMPQDATQITSSPSATGLRPTTDTGETDIQQLPELKIDRVDLPPIGIPAPIILDRQ
jgi:chemotaxis protein MotB